MVPKIYGGFHSDSAGIECTCNAGDAGLIPGSGRSPGGEHGNPLQYSRWQNHMDRGAWQAMVRGVTKSQKQLKLLSTQNLPGEDTDSVLSET